MEKSAITKVLLIICGILIPILSFAADAYVYVGGPSKSLPRPWPPRGTLVTANYIPYGGASEYIYCIGNSVKATKYTNVTLQVRCDYYYDVTETNYSSGNSFTYRYSGVEYYSVEIQKVSLNVPNTLTLNVGDEKSIDWSYSPSSGIEKPKVEWSTSNYSVASVNSSGYITARGSGTATITGTNNAGPNAEIKVTVNDIPVTGATIASSYSVLADQSKTLSVTVTPSNATVKSKKWYSADSNIARINEYTGELTGVWPNTTKVWCVVNGTVRSNEATVTVKEPSFTFSGFSVVNGSTEVETKPTLTAEFSHNLSRGDNYGDIRLTDSSGQQVDGALSISGTMLKFTPSKHLQPTTNYTWTIPSGALKNKWGTSYSATKKMSFTTTDWQRMTLTVQPDVKFLNHDDQIVLTCSAPGATIYYSTDGSEPSKVYSNPLTFETDMTLRAIARLDGYYDSNEINHEYLQSVEIVEKFPGKEALYNYADVNPYIVFSQPIKKGALFGSITLKKEGYIVVDCEVLVFENALFLVPNEPLEQGCAFTVTLPEGVIVTANGEENKALDWHFGTGDYATAVSTGGPELMASIRTDGSLWTWGKRLTEANAEDGSYSYDTVVAPAAFVSGDVVAVSSGYMHHALLKRDGSLWMWGRQLCGEFGNGSTTASAQPIKVMDGVKQVSCGLQTTAIVKQDGTLWMCGRNDLGQIDDSRTVHTSYIKVADNVSKATLHWGSIDIIKTDGSTEVRTWDANADEGRMPTETGLADAAQVEYGWQNAVALGQDGSVWTWGQDHSLSEVIAGRNPQPLEGIRLLMPSMHLEVGERTIIAQRPVPLLADYSELTWHTSNADIATINSRGLVEALSDGYTTVTATISDAQGQRYEAQCNITVGNANTIQTLSLAKGWNWISTYLQEPQPVSGLADGSSRIVSQEKELIRDPQFGMVGSLTAMEPGKAYKVEADNTYNCMFGGSLYDSLSPITLKKGWNWIGYPMAHTMAPGEALAIAESEEGELLIGQDGMAVYSDGQWTGTLTEMVPGQGFMYRSASDKNLFYNAMAQASSRRSKAQYSSYNLQSAIPDDWRVDKHRYPNVMGLIAQLWIDESLADAGDWILGAFSADECRGIAMAIDGNGTSEAVLMMNVYGSGGEPITFCVVNRETGEVFQAIEQEPFRADVVGTMSQPYALHIGTVTGVQTVAADARHAAVYDLQGRRVDGVQAGKGIYVVSGGKRSRAQKIVKK